MSIADTTSRGSLPVTLPARAIECSDRALKVLFYWWDIYKNENARKRSNARVAKELKISVDTLKRAYEELETLKLMQRDPLAGRTSVKHLFFTPDEFDAWHASKNAQHAPTAASSTEHDIDDDDLPECDPHPELSSPAPGVSAPVHHDLLNSLTVQQNVVKPDQRFAPETASGKSNGTARLSNGQIITFPPPDAGMFEAVLKYAFGIIYVPKMRLSKTTRGHVNRIVKSLQESDITTAQYIAYAENYRREYPNLDPCQSESKLPLDVLKHVQRSAQPEPVSRVPSYVPFVPDPPATKYATADDLERGMLKLLQDKLAANPDDEPLQRRVEVLARRIARITSPENERVGSTTATTDVLQQQPASK